MPIRRLSPLRAKKKGKTPFFYFVEKGRNLDSIARKIERLPEQKIISVFRELGVKPRIETELAHNLKEKVLSELKNLQESGDKSKIFFLNTALSWQSPRFVAFQLKILPSKKRGLRVYLRQHPVTHGVRGAVAFEGLKSILREGFRKWRPGAENVFIEMRRGKLGLPIHSLSKGVTEGDTYAVEMMASMGDVHWVGGGREAKFWVSTVNEAPLQQILRVNIRLAEVPEKQIDKKKKYYEREITRRFGVPVYFIKPKKKRK